MKLLNVFTWTALLASSGDENSMNANPFIALDALNLGKLEERERE